MNEDFKMGYSKGNLIAFLTVIFISVVFSLTLILKRPYIPDTWLILFILELPFACLVFFWVTSFRIEILGKTLRYYSLMGGFKEIPLDDIKKVKYEYGDIKKDIDKYRPPFRLVVIPYHDAAPPFDINIKLFKLDDIRNLDLLLKDKFQGAKKKNVRVEE